MSSVVTPVQVGGPPPPYYVVYPPASPGGASVVVTSRPVNRIARESALYRPWGPFPFAGSSAWLPLARH